MIKRKRIGANAQRRINARKSAIKSFFNNKVVQYTIYTIFGAITIALGWLLFSLAIILDSSNLYMN